jgi:ABC-type transporter Mla MlaB component
MYPCARLDRSGPRIALHGELDVAAAPELARLNGEARPSTVDLAGVTFIDAAGIGNLVNVTNQGCPRVPRSAWWLPHLDCGAHSALSNSVGC